MHYDASPADSSFAIDPKPDTAKRLAAGLCMELELARNGKALRHDRYDVFDEGSGRHAAAGTWSE